MSKPLPQQKERPWYEYAYVRWPEQERRYVVHFTIGGSPPLPKPCPHCGRSA